MRAEDLDLSALLPRGSRVLCAVSGGADSMCLLHLLWSNREALGLKVCAAHYEHGLREKESARDAAFAERWCAERDIPFRCGHGDVLSRAKASGRGVEETAREMRYAFLEETADALCCDRIATAHNADDNAETLLLHLCRGAGAAGLSGIPMQRGRIVRPLLGCTRAEIEEYLEENRVPHVEDSSNLSDDYARNLLRHRVMPVLRELNPRLAPAMARTAELLRQDEQCLDALAGDFLAKNYDGESLPAEALAALDPAIAARVLRRLCGPVEKRQIDAALALCRGTERASLDLPGLRLVREQGRLFFGAPEQPEPIAERRLIPGETLLIPEAGLRVKAEFTVYSGEINDLFKTCCLKCANIRGELLCTGRRPGDRLRIAGRGCTKSLKALFTEAGMTSRKRERTLVIRDGEGVLLARGLALAERSVPVAGDEVLKITVDEIEERGHA